MHGWTGMRDVSKILFLAHETLPHTNVSFQHATASALFHVNSACNAILNTHSKASWLTF